MTNSDRFQEGQFSRDAQRSAPDPDVDHALRTITVRVPKSLFDDLHDLAYLRRTSLNRLCNDVLQREVNNDADRLPVERSEP